MTANKKQQIIKKVNKSFLNEKDKLYNCLCVGIKLQKALLAYYNNPDNETYKNYIHAIAEMDIEIDKCRIFNTKIIEAAKVNLLEKLDREVKQ